VLKVRRWVGYLRDSICSGANQSLPHLQQQCALCGGECIQKQRAKHCVMGNRGALQQIESCVAQLGAGAPAIIGAGEPPHEPAALQTLDGAGESTRAEADYSRQTSHALGATGNCQCAEQFVFPEREPVNCLQLGVQPP
jgi:hypothetical protein